MAAFNDTDLDKFDYQLLQGGPINLFQSETVLDDCINELQSLKYAIRRLDAKGLSVPAFLDSIASTLDFPDYFGKNLDALNDCMHDIASADYGWNAESDAGLALVVTHYDSFNSANPKEAQIIADIFADNSRLAMLFGNRLIILLQVDDGDFRLAPLGATSAHWNSREWLDSSRKR
jgi:hypothetical protein